MISTGDVEFDRLLVTYGALRRPSEYSTGDEWQAWRDASTAILRDMLRIAKAHGTWFREQDEPD